MKYRHLFFDLDHTLWDFETNAKQTLSDLHRHNELHKKVFPILTFSLSDTVTTMSGFGTGIPRVLSNRKNFAGKECGWHCLILNWQMNLLPATSQCSFLNSCLQNSLFPYTVEILTYLKGKGLPDASGYKWF
jgi:putative hydrolase of the HAD superfamily